MSSEPTTNPADMTYAELLASQGISGDELLLIAREGQQRQEVAEMLHTSPVQLAAQVSQYRQMLERRKEQQYGNPQRRNDDRDKSKTTGSAWHDDPHEPKRDDRQKSDQARREAVPPEGSGYSRRNREIKAAATRRRSTKSTFTSKATWKKK